MDCVQYINCMFVELANEYGEGDYLRCHREWWQELSKEVLRTLSAADLATYKKQLEFKLHINGGDVPFEKWYC